MTHLTGIRDVLMAMDTLVLVAETLPRQNEKLRTMLMAVWYSCTQTHSRKPRTLMNIPAMVDGWHRAILALSTGHSKEDIDHAEFALDELMAPILTAPVRQLREFWKQLERALKEDTLVPFFVWRIVEIYGKVAVESATDQAIIALKTALAREIAGLVEKDVQPDIMEAITGALRWRDPETLAQIRDAVKAGEKPRLRGKQSCLFLVAGGHEVML